MPHFAAKVIKIVLRWQHVFFHSCFFFTQHIKLRDLLLSAVTLSLQTRKQGNNRAIVSPEGL